MLRDERHACFWQLQYRCYGGAACRPCVIGRPRCHPLKPDLAALRSHPGPRHPPRSWCDGGGALRTLAPGCGGAHEHPACQHLPALGSCSSFPMECLHCSPASSCNLCSGSLLRPVLAMYICPLRMHAITNGNFIWHPLSSTTVAGLQAGALQPEDPMLKPCLCEAPRACQA